MGAIISFITGGIFILACIILFVIAFVITFVILEKRKVNKHKKNQNYEPKNQPNDMLDAEKKVSNMNKND